MKHLKKIDYYVYYDNFFDMSFSTRPYFLSTVISVILTWVQTAQAETFTVTFDLTDFSNYSSDAGPNPPAGAFWIEGISNNSNVNVGHFFGRNWNQQVLIYDSGHGRIAESDYPSFFGSQSAPLGDKDPPAPPAPYFSWSLDVGDGYQLDSFTVNLDGYSPAGTALHPNTSWMGTSKDAFGSPTALAFSDSNFDFTSALSGLAHDGSLETRVYTGGSTQFFFDSVTINGSLSAVPEPSGIVLLLATGFVSLFRRWR